MPLQLINNITCKDYIAHYTHRYNIMSCFDRNDSLLLAFDSNNWFVKNLSLDSTNYELLTGRRFI